MNSNFGKGFLAGLLLMLLISCLSLQGCVQNAQLFDERERTYAEIARMSSRMEELKQIERADAAQVQTMVGIAEELRQRCR